MLDGVLSPAPLGGSTITFRRRIDRPDYEARLAAIDAR